MLRGGKAELKPEFLFNFLPEKVCILKIICIFATESGRNPISMMHKLINSHLTEVA